MLRPCTPMASSRSLWLVGFLGGVLALAHGACQRHGTSLPAPFRQSQLSPAAGALTGPFSGIVTDDATEEPISGALVQVTWAFVSGAFSDPAGSKSAVVSTDAAGGYTLPAVEIPKGTRLADAVLVVYKRGYVGYRSDRRFADLGSRRDFVQRGHAIALERWNDRYSHARHVRYLGGGEALSALSRWELEAAAMELSGTRAFDGAAFASGARAVGGNVLVAAQLLSELDIKGATKFAGTFETGPLEDEPDTEIYSSQHFAAVGHPDRYDLAIRQWRFAPTDATAFLAELRTRLGGRDFAGLASQAFAADEGDIHGLGFVDIGRGLVVLLTCGNALCTDAAQLETLAHLAHDRIVKALPLAAPATGVLP